MKLNPFLKELIWLFIAYTLSLIFGFTIFNLYISNSALDIHLHDTYFTGNKWMIAFELFLLLTFFAFFIKELRNKFCNSLPNIIMIISGFILMILSYIFIRKSIKFNPSIQGGWTVYPPLSDLSQTNISKEINSAIIPFDYASNLFGILQMTVTICLFVVAYYWGVAKGKRITTS